MNRGMRGAENLTWLERLLTRVPVSYNFATILLGVAAFATHVAADIPMLQQKHSWSLYLGFITYPILAFYAYRAVRFMRMEVLRAGRDIVRVTPGRERAYHKAFTGLGRSGPPSVFALIIALPAIIAVINDPAYLLLWYVIAAVFLYVGVAALLWAYLVCVWGLYSVGKQSLRLKSVYEDKMQGAGPVGSLSLSLTTTYFVGLGLAALHVSFTFAWTISRAPFYLALIVGLTILGLMLFVLPLYNIHLQMADAKRSELRRIQDHLCEVLVWRIQSPTQSKATIRDVRDVLTEMRSISACEVAERRVSAAPTWPVDMRVLSRLTAVVISVFVAVAAQFIIVVLSP